MQSFLAVDFNKQTQKITLTILYFLYKKEFEQKLPYFPIKFCDVQVQNNAD